MSNLNKLSRQEIVELLESVGIACYDSENTEMLREALRVNVEDGTIELEEGHLTKIFENSPIDMPSLLSRATVNEIQTKKVKMEQREEDINETTERSTKS